MKEQTLSLSHLFDFLWCLFSNILVLHPFVRSFVRSIGSFHPFVPSIHSICSLVPFVRSFIHSWARSLFPFHYKKQDLLQDADFRRRGGTVNFGTEESPEQPPSSHLSSNGQEIVKRLNFQWINSDRYGWMMQYRARVSFLFVQKRGTSVIFSLWNYPASFSCFWWMKNLRLFSPISFSANRIHGGDWSPGACWTQQTQSSVVDAPWPH